MKLDRVREKLLKENYISFTTDLDWAPECAIKDTLEMFVGNKIRPTVFITHTSAEVKKFTEAIDVGIHPNLIMPSSQGNNQEEILDFCCGLVSDTKVFRCHRWYASNDVYKYLWNKGYRYESNLCTNMDVVGPFAHRSGMISFPVFFEDGAHIEHNKELQYSHFKDYFRRNGLKVINIHPMHYALNTPYFSYTRGIKDRLSREEWNGMDESRLKELKYDGLGIRDFINDMIEDALSNGAKVISLLDAYKMCLEGQDVQPSL
ncbi:hypothetical protein SAMN04487928_11952 [Butyrivibrio proteoclasticus]|uniref:Polysaccharide deacetylase n=1 Tax=Butyrivibrio proteoclasticus TaxID=43305 RepID=A0A1I5VVU6_9FIRM|nr:hypothetical protein [Butyrivibrio proteoclasticus]SFQ11704.1 hypothetical protein SAMN04487928_11952 [Butyrivibrio proteoclasticus]